MSLEKLEQKGLYLDFKCYENIQKISVLFEKCHVFHKFSILSIKYEKRKRKKKLWTNVFFLFFFFFCIYKDRLPEKQGFQASAYLYAFISFIYQYRICQTGLFFNTKSYTDSTSVHWRCSERLLGRTCSSEHGSMGRCSMLVT